MKKCKGFTLLELMIVVVIVGILAAIAIPSYISYIHRANRVDAKNALLGMQMQEEKFRMTNTLYSNSIGSGSPIRANAESDEGYYNLSISNVTASTYALTATAIGSQADDTDCRTLTLNQDGVKTAVNSDGGSTSSTCW